MLAHFSGKTADEASPGRRTDGTERRSYWDEVPRFLEMRADLKRDWPARQRAAIDSSADPPGSADAVIRVREAEPGVSAYAQAIEQENGYYDIKERYESRGCEMYLSKNWWTNSEYKGVNTRWLTPEGHRFEVQFHTPESFHAKHHVTHTAYERIRDPATSDEERAEFRAFQREVSSWIRVPDGAADIPDYRKEGF